jgi:UPF0716 protein FxsA
MPFVLLYLVVEIVAVVALASCFGFGWTLVVLLAGAVLGIWLARREGLRGARALAEAARDRRVAHVETTDGMLVAAGGLLLLVPGLVTDVAGLILLLPPTRAVVRRRMVRAAERRAPGLRTARIRTEGPVIDGEVVVDGGVVDRDVADRDAADRDVVDRLVLDRGVVEGEVVDPSPRTSEP